MQYLAEMCYSVAKFGQLIHKFPAEIENCGQISMTMESFTPDFKDHCQPHVSDYGESER
jgi:hypothetical protein